jgi:hypothetical protein
MVTAVDKTWSFFLKKGKSYFQYKKTTDLNYKEINCTEPSALVRVPWTNSPAYFAAAAMAKKIKFL